MPHYTRLNSGPPFLKEPSPLLFYQKSHAYDDSRQFKKGKSRPAYLRQVAELINNARLFNDWRTRWDCYLASLPPAGMRLFSLPTIWRLVIGMGTNPALETGLTLHHLLGFPYLPGSAVKGQLHHFMEMQLAESWPRDWPSDKKADLNALDDWITKARYIRLIFGSLTTSQTQEGVGPTGLVDALRSNLHRIGNTFGDKIPREWVAKRDVLQTLLSEPTSGVIDFLDAVPQRGFEVQVDILNPHYPDYYEDPSKQHPPSDDQSPGPVYFLAVAPGVQFTFAFRLARRTEASPEGSVLRECGIGEAEMLDDLKNRLQDALARWGIGAKTAAGYGYFDGPNLANAELAPVAKGATPATKAPPRSPAEIAKAYLPEGLGPGELANRIDQIMDQPEEVQRYVADLLGKQYAAEIAKWRKKADKATVAKRLEWLERISRGEK